MLADHGRLFLFGPQWPCRFRTTESFPATSKRFCKTTQSYEQQQQQIPVASAAAASNLLAKKTLPMFKLSPTPSCVPAQSQGRHISEEEKIHSKALGMRATSAWNPM